MKTRFENADEAFVYFLNEIRCNGIEFGDTKALFNVGFTLEKPRDMFILDRERKYLEMNIHKEPSGISRDGMRAHWCGCGCGCGLQSARIRNCLRLGIARACGGGNTRGNGNEENELTGTQPLKRSLW